LNNNLFWGCNKCVIKRESPDFRRNISLSSSVPKRKSGNKPSYRLLLPISFSTCSNLKMEVLCVARNSRLSLNYTAIYSTQSQPKGLQIQHYLFYSTNVRVRSFIFCGLHTSISPYSEILPETTRLFRRLVEFLE
jgi:hypothetical protein